MKGYFEIYFEKGNFKILSKLAYFDFLEKWIIWLCQKPYSLVKWTQWILWVNFDHQNDLSLNKSKCTFVLFIFQFEFLKMNKNQVFYSTYKLNTYYYGVAIFATFKNTYNFHSLCCSFLCLTLCFGFFWVYFVYDIDFIYK
jgi:hypothetical protein